MPDIAARVGNRMSKANETAHQEHVRAETRIADRQAQIEEINEQTIISQIASSNPAWEMLDMYEQGGIWSGIFKIDDKEFYITAQEGP